MMLEDGLVFKANILAWCLMPNDFHLMLYPNSEGFT
jgi:hypothetical protein